MTLWPTKLWSLEREIPQNQGPAVDALVQVKMASMLAELVRVCM